MRKQKKFDRAIVLFLLPAAVIYISVIVLPVIYSFYLSLFTGSGISNWSFCGLNNYLQLLKDQDFLVALKNTVIWIILTLLVSITIPLAFAVILNKNFPGRTFFRGFFYFPCAVAPIAVAIIWRWIYNPDIGFINQLLGGLKSNLSQNLLGSPNTALIACFIAAQWQAIGMPMILYLAGLQTVPEDVLEAATIDGASGINRFLKVTVPLMKETFVMVISTQLIGAMKVYDIVKGLTNGGPSKSSEVLASYMYSQTFDYNHWGYGSAIACLMVVMMLFIIVPYLNFTARKQ